MAVLGERTDSMPRGEATEGRGAVGGIVGVDRDASGTGCPATGCVAGSVGVCVGVCACTGFEGFGCVWGG